MSRKTWIALLCVPLLLSAHTAGAVDRDWNKSSGTQVFNEAANWSPGAVPLAGDSLTFGLDGDVDIFLGAPSVGDDITFTDGIVEFRSVGGSTLNSGGVVTIDDAFATGLANGAQVLLNGATWDSAGDATIGDIGFGTLTINSGGDFEANRVFIGSQAGGTGMVTATGAGTTITASLVSNMGVFIVGLNGGTGTLNILDDADLRTTSTVGNDIVVGRDAGSIGTLNIDGAGSFAETEDLNIGVSGGTGFLNITDGGQVINTDGGTPDTSFGVSTGSAGTGLIDGDDSLLRSRLIDVGFEGLGRVTVSGGGFVRTVQQGTAIGDMRIGFNAGSDGKVAVFGSGSSTSSLDVDNTLRIGKAGLGVLLIGQEMDGTANGTGALQVDIDIFVGENLGNTADNMLVVDGANATVNAGDVIYVGHAGRGTMNVTGGGVVTNARARVGQTGTGDGTVLVDGRGSQWDMATDLFVGTSGKGRLTISDGGFVDSGNATLAIGSHNGSDGAVTVTGVNDNGTPGNTADDLRSTLNGTGQAELYVGGFTGQSGALGKLEVLDGGFAKAREDNFIGSSSGGNGWLLVSGVNANGFRSIALFDDNSSTGTINDVTFVGASASEGRVEVSDGGLLDAERLVINGGPADATLFGLAQLFNETVLASGVSDNGTPGNTTDDIASEINVLGRIEVGVSRQTSMRIEDGAQVISNTIRPAGGLADGLTLIGNGAAADNSSVVITGAGSKWFDAYDPESDVQTNNDFVIGNSATGVTLDIEAGGALQTGRGVIARLGGSSGVVTVTGNNSRWDATSLIVGNLATGTLNVNNGGTIVSGGLTEVGNGSTGIGTLAVTGNNSSSTAVTYTVGDTNGARGTVTVTLGGTVTATDSVDLAENPGSIGDVTIGTVNAGDAVATLDVGNNLNVGGDNGGAGGTGTLNVEASGKVIVTNLLKVWTGGTANLSGGTIETDLLEVDQVGDFHFNTGTLRFTGNKTLDAPALDGIFAGAPVPTLGANQHLEVIGTTTLGGSLRLNDATASLSVGTIINLSNLDWDAGTLEITGDSVTLVDGGLLGESLNVDQDQAFRLPNHVLLIGADSELYVTRGGLSAAAVINGGLMVVSRTIDVDVDADDDGAGLTNNGTLVVIDATINGDFDNNGQLEMVGDVVFGGNASFGGGSIDFDLGGTAPDDFDSLDILGDASLGGALSVTLGSGFSPAAGNTFEIITAANVQNMFDVENLPSLAGLSWIVNYSAGNVVLEVVSGLTGDYNNDGIVNAADYTTWRDTLGQTGTGLAADGDNSGTIDIADYTVWKNNFGMTAPAALAGAPVPVPVPEPATACLLLMGLLTVLITKRQGERG